MGTSWQTSSRIQGWISGITNPDRLEAPDRNFVGHRDILTRSLARYHFVEPHLHGVTLDVGCGRGYGFEAIAARTRSQVGIDVSHEFLQDAQVAFPATPLSRASGEALPFVSGSFDSIIAFEVIEHMQDDLAFLHELKRLVRSDAFISISTPNKLISSGDSNTPLNRFHAREYTASEFHTLLCRVFSSVQVFGQFEGAEETPVIHGIIDSIPMRWKYMVPLYVQGVVGAALRPPLPREACHFRSDRLDTTHTFVALCRP